MFRQHLSSDGTPEQWAFISSVHPLSFDRDLSVIPEGHRAELWPAILSDYSIYNALAEKEITSGVRVNEPYLWREYTAEQEWSQTPPKSFHSQHQIKEQLFYGIGAAVISIGALFIALLFTKRFIAVDSNAYYPASSAPVPFCDIYKIDKRSWQTKGMATLYCKSANGERKVKVDGMIYGQFDKAQGAPAERLFQIILDHFKGELIDYEDIESPSSKK